MKWFLVVTLVLSLNLLLVESKTVDKASPKKSKPLKPAKSSKTLLDYFNNLSPEDRAFLKDVDRQFKAHGDKIKIKVERANSTEASGNKNSKRTIDGELGYGYEQNHYDHGYQFSKPQYYPAQKGYTNGAGHRYTNAAYHEVATDIEILPSQGYEVKPETYVQNKYSYNYDAQPVIVLKIPGPTKYAQHLQALLQQYLELRAAQYLQLFEEQERYQQAQYVQPQYTYYHHPMVQVAPQIYQHVQPQYYRSEPKQQYQKVYYNDAAYQYYQPTAYQSPNYDSEVQYETEYAEAAPSVEPLHHSEAITTTEDYSSVVPLKTVENYPSPSHTQVIFKEDQVPYQVDEAAEHETDQVENVSAGPEYVEITQRVPYNYHAHPTRSAKRSAGGTAPYTEEEFKNYNRLIQKMKRQNAVKVIEE